MSNGENEERRPLPSRYDSDGADGRWRRLWIHRGDGAGSQHIDDDGVDPEQDVGGRLPPLPDDMREEGKYNGRLPDSSQQLQPGCP